MAVNNLLFGSAIVPEHGSGSHTGSGVTPGDYPAFSVLRIDDTGVVTLASLRWAAPYTFAANQVCLASNSKLYRAVISNAGNDPTTDDGTNWVRATMPAGGTADGQVPVWDNALKEFVPGSVAGVGGYADAEVPTGTINGANLAFNLAHTPSPAASLALFSDGVYMTRGVDYTLTVAAILFASTDQTPKNGLIAHYRY